MRLFVDESLSPQLALLLNETGRHDAVHPLHVGRRREPDHRVFARCLAEDRVLVTQNAKDFRKLAAKAELHPGLIIIPGVSGRLARELLWRAIAYLEERGEPMDLMVNQVLEMSADGEIRLMPLPG